MKKTMFNDKFGLTQAVLEGRKTMTRRSVSDDILNKYQDYLKWKGVEPSEREFYLCESPIKVNEVIAVAQSYKDVADYLRHQDKYKEAAKREIYYMSAGWSNKMFVKADAMVHHIKITEIKVERLQDISDDDCLREGIKQIKSEDVPQITEAGKSYYTFCGVTGIWTTPRKAFAALIDKVSGKGTWDSNPWVFVYEFKLIK